MCFKTHDPPIFKKYSNICNELWNDYIAINTLKKKSTIDYELKMLFNHCENNLID